jgi:FtsH-binding integral membrane protein
MVAYQSVGVKIYSLIHRVFMWMGIALTVTGTSAFFITRSPEIQKAVLTKGWLVALIVAQLALVVILSFFILKISYSTALFLFILYSGLNGVLLSVIFTIYTTGSIVATFFIAAAMFIAMALYGALTKVDLTSMGSFLMMALWGLIIALIVNLFLGNQLMEFITAFVGVIVFSGLTAFDIQRIKQLSAHLLMQDEKENKVALLGALQLYLDFINIFLSLLRLTGRSRQ